MDRVPAVQQGRVQYLQRQLLFRGRGRRVFRGHGALAQVPVTSYLVISSIPLLPGAGIYYTMSIGLSGSVQAALQKGLETAGIAGSLAVGILLVSTVFRAVNARRRPAAHL